MIFLTLIETANDSGFPLSNFVELSVLYYSNGKNIAAILYEDSICFCLLLTYAFILILKCGQTWVTIKDRDEILKKI